MTVLVILDYITNDVHFVRIPKSQADRIGDEFENDIEAWISDLQLDKKIGFDISNANWMVAEDNLSTFDDTLNEDGTVKVVQEYSVWPYDAKYPAVVKRHDQLDDIVTITCYNKTEKMKRRDAIKLYADGMACCEGSERDRYTEIYMQLIAGKMECYDD